MLDSGKYHDKNQVIPRVIDNITKLKAFCLTGCLFLFILAGCRNDLQVIDELYTEEEVKFDIAEAPVMTYTELGMKRLDIHAPVLKSWNQNPRKTEFPEGLEVAFYNGQTNTSNLTADYGVNMEQSKELIVEGNVVFKNDKGEMLETERLTWNEQDAKIRTDSEIRITTVDEIITGVGLEADEDFSNYSIRQISGIVHIED